MSVELARTELRDPRAATIKPWFTSPTLPMIYEWDATQAFRLGYAANVIAYRCIWLRAAAAASVPLVAGRRQGDYKTVNERAPIARLLGPPPGGPAPKLSATKLFRWTYAQHITTGRRAWEIETDRQGRIVAFWPLASANVRAIPTDGGTEWFKVFETGPYHDPVKLAPEDVFYGWQPGGLEFRQAESPLQALRYDLSLVTLCDRYGIGFLRNNAVPAAIVTTSEFPDDDHRQRFLANWQAEYGGPDNAGRVAVNEVSDDGDGPVGDSIDVKVLGLSAKDARLVEQRKECMTEIAIGLGTPWSKLDASGRTFDNAEAEDRDWWENTILPDLVDLQDDINMQLAPRLGDEVVWFDLRNVRALQRRFKPISQTVGVPALVQSQVMMINEARADYGLEPLPDGDRMMTAEEIAALSPSAAPFLLGPAPVTPPSVEPPSPPPPVELPAPNTPDEDDDRIAATEDRALDPEAVEVRRTRIWRASDAVVTALERRWVRAWRRLFARQLEATLARLHGKRGRQMLAEARADEPFPVDPGAVFDLEHWQNESMVTADDLFDETLVAAAQRIALQFGIAFDLAAPWVQDFIEQRVLDLAGHVTQTTYDAIRIQLTEGVAQGESIDKLADRVRTVFAQADELRATTIARTEVISAYNGAASLGAAQLPPDVVAGQEWIATRDSRVRETHASADGQVVAVGQPFTVGIAQGAYPGDPSLPASETVNCRCTVAFLTPDEYAEAVNRAPRRVEVRTALAMLRFADKDTDLLAWRRALEEVAA